MHLILLSGGSGKRLWPLSNDVRSKQFLKLLKDENGSAESMVQRVYRQINTVGGWDSITVAASSSQRDMISLQLGDEVNVVIEPERRDTFPAIVLACAYLFSEKKVNRDEIVGILPVDPYVDDDYFYRIKEISKVFQNEEEKVDLVLLGAQPTFPTEKYGYIVPKSYGNLSNDQKSTQILDVSYFKEKPSVDFAGELIKEGALWNCGVFGLKLGYILDLLSDKYKSCKLDYTSFREAYKTLNKTSFDYEIVENAQNIKVIPYNKRWMDLGTWQTITLEMKNTAEGNVFIEEDTCNNTHIINELDMPVVAMGIKDAVIVATHDGILVSNKEVTHRLKNMVENIKNRPMYERKRWGRYKVLEANEKSLTKKLILEPGKSISYQYHVHRKEVWTIVSGEGILILEGNKSKVYESDVISIDKLIKHGIYATTELHIIEVQIGTNLVEDDIIRLELEWEKKNE